MITISYAGGPTITPDTAEIGTTAIEAEARTVVHDILDGAPVHTLRPAGPRRGEFVLTFADEIAAADAFDAHRLAAVFRIASPVRAVLNFGYVVAGALRLEMDRDSAAFWILTVPYEEVI